MPSAWTSAPAALAFRVAANSPLIRSTARKLDELARRDPSQIGEWQSGQVRRMVGFARRRSPYYRACLPPGDRLEDASITPKQEVTQRFADFRVPRVPARTVTTGGTGGRPASIAVSHRSFFSEWAHIAYAWGEAGISLTSPKLTFRGSNLGQGFEEAPVLFQATYNQFAVSPFHLSEKTFNRLLDEMGDFRPRAIWGYPSAITPFARWAAQAGPLPQLSHVRAVLLASEAAFDWQRSLFEQAFGARVVQWYGQSEKVAFASGCSGSGAYHVLPTYGLVELVDGAVIATGFTNRAMPLLRYDTEDRASRLAPSCACGLPFPTLSGIEGRWDQALLWGVDDEPISTSALNFHDPVFMGFDRFQFRQQAAGEVALLVVPGNGDAGSLQRAGQALQRRVGDRLRIEVVEAEPSELLSERGKVVTVDQRYSPPAQAW